MALNKPLEAKRLLQVGIDVKDFRGKQVVFKNLTMANGTFAKVRLVELFQAFHQLAAIHSFKIMALLKGDAKKGIGHGNCLSANKNHNYQARSSKIDLR